MRENTRIAIEQVKAQIGDRYFTEKDIKGVVSIHTLRKYGLVTAEQYEAKREEYSIADLIAELNDREGEDGWYDFSDGHGEWLLENGKAYYVWKVWGYRFI